MGFQIKDAQGNPVILKELDCQAAEFWTVPMHEKWYAAPRKQGVSTNWFDSIGWNIHYNQAIYRVRTDDVITWEMVKESMMLTHIDLLHEDVCKKIGFARLYLIPYFSLVDHWASMGYIPIKTVD